MELGLLALIIGGNLVIGAVGLIYYGCIVFGVITILIFTIYGIIKVVEAIVRACHWIKELLEL